MNFDGKFRGAPPIALDVGSAAGESPMRTPTLRHALAAAAVAPPRSSRLLRMLSTVPMPPGLVTNTPLLESAPLSELLGTTVLLKLDALQPSGSFKDRRMAYMGSELMPS